MVECERTGLAGRVLDSHNTGLLAGVCVLHHVEPIPASVFTGVVELRAGQANRAAPKSPGHGLHLHPSDGLAIWPMLDEIETCGVRRHSLKLGLVFKNHLNCLLLQRHALLLLQTVRVGLFIFRAHCDIGDERPMTNAALSFPFGASLLATCSSARRRPGRAAPWVCAKATAFGLSLATCVTGPGTRRIDRFGVFTLRTFLDRNRHLANPLPRLRDTD